MEQWSRNGYFILPDLLSEEDCEVLKAASLAVLAKYARPGATVYVGCAAVEEKFAELAEHPVIVGALRSIMPDGVEFMSDKIVYKKPGKSFPTPWHIDAWYWKNTRPKISVWIPFEDTSAANGTLTIVPGSHRYEWIAEQTKGVNGEFSLGMRKEDIPTIEEVHVCEVRRGTGIVFSDRLLHGSTAAEESRERFAIIPTYHAPGQEEYDSQFSARKVLVSHGKLRRSDAVD